MQQALSALGLSFGATKEEIKQAFRHLAALYHPDVNSEPGATEYYLYVQSAYEYLMALPDTPPVYNESSEPKTKGDDRAAGTGANVRYYGNVAVTVPPEGADMAVQGGGWTNMSGGSRILGSRESLSQAATRRKFKEEHRKQENRLKMREEQRKKKRRSGWRLNAGRGSLMRRWHGSMRSGRQK